MNIYAGGSGLCDGVKDTSSTETAFFLRDSPLTSSSFLVSSPARSPPRGGGPFHVACVEGVIGVSTVTDCKPPLRARYRHASATPER
jgi:hypothetical protein